MPHALRARVGNIRCRRIEVVKLLVYEAQKWLSCHLAPFQLLVCLQLVWVKVWLDHNAETDTVRCRVAFGAFGLNSLTKYM